MSGVQALRPPRPVSGAGGGGGASEQGDTLRSTQTADVLDLVSEGEIEGLTNGLKSIYLDGVPLQNADDTFNFTGVLVSTTDGTQGQASIAGADGVQNEVPVSVAVLAATPVVRTITNPAIDSVRVTIAVPQLSEQDTGSGDLKGSRFTWAIDVQSNGGGYVQVLADEVLEGKTMSRYTRAKLVRLAGAAPWDVRVRRVSADSGSATVVNAFQWSSYTEIQSLRLRYPNSAMVRTRVDASQFARVPERAFDVMGLRVQVPVNYDPITRVYTGTWDGTCTIAWTDNPAWIFYDLVRHERYGLGRYVTIGAALKWQLYRIGQYCDELVPDGRGGMEPRFRCGLVLSTREQAYKVLTDLAAIFRGICYWSNSDVSVQQDAPADPVTTFTPANTVNRGSADAPVYFTYASGSDAKRHSSAVVWFNSLAERGKRVPEVYVDRDLEARYGVEPLELSPLGCWSRGQAHRLGKWAIYSERQDGTVALRAALDGALLAPGKVFEVADPNEQGERLGGRVHSATTTAVTLDAAVTLHAGETYTLTTMVQDPDDPARLRREQRTVSNAAGITNAITVASAFSSAPAPAAVWVLQSTAIAATTWRCVSVAEVAGTNDYEIVGIAHAPEKFDLIEQGIQFEARPISRITLRPPAPTLLVLTETPYRVGSAYRSRVTVSWREPARGLQYTVRSRYNGGQWTELPRTGDNSVDVDGLPVGFLQVSVQAVNALGNRSALLEGDAMLHGKTARPGNVAGFTATVVQGGVRFAWVANQEDDYLCTTLKIGGAIIFEGAASSFFWAQTVLGSYTVTATHWDTSINESATPASVTVTVDDSVHPADWSDAQIVAGSPAPNLRGTSADAAGIGASNLHSADGYTGGCFASCVIRSPTQPTGGVVNNFVIGLSTTPIAYDLAHIDWGIHPSSNGKLYAYEGATGYEIASGWGYGDVVTVSYDGVHVRWMLSGIVLREVAASISARLYLNAILQSVTDSMSNIRFGPLTDIGPLAAAAVAAASAASAAQAYATAALAEIAAIEDDGLLTPDEKPRVVYDFVAILAEQAGIDAQAANYAVTAEATAYDTAISNLTTYLGTLTSPTAWNIYTGNTTITGSTFHTAFNTVYLAKQAVLDKIAANAKARLGALATRNTVGTAHIDAGAVDEVYQDAYDFGGAATVTGPVVQWTKTITPTADCTVEISGTVNAYNVYPDAANYLALQVTAGSASPVTVANCDTNNGTSRQQYGLISSFPAVGSVALTFELLSDRHIGNPAIQLYEFRLRTTLIYR